MTTGLTIQLKKGWRLEIVRPAKCGATSWRRRFPNLLDFNAVTGVGVCEVIDVTSSIDVVGYPEMSVTLQLTAAQARKLKKIL